MPGWRRRRSRCSWPRRSTASSTSIFGSRSRRWNFPASWISSRNIRQRRPTAGVDLLGYFLPPFAYSELQILAQAVAATKTLDNDKLAEYLHSHPFQTIEGDIAFGPDGEWTEARPIWAQYHDIKGHGVDQFRGSQTITILAPDKYKTGEMIYPYAKAKGE